MTDEPELQVRAPTTVDYNPPATDRFTVRLVVFFLGALALMGMLFVGLLAMDGHAIPDSLVAICSGVIGALGAMLAKTSS